MKTVLISGANGFIGKNFIEMFSDKFQIIQLSRESQYDILDLDSLLSIDDVDVVMHFAAKTFVPDSFDKPHSFYKFNINSTLNIAEFCRVKKIKKFIYLNSYTYGNPQYLPIDELHPVSFHSPYNKSKYLAEELSFKYLEQISRVVSLRLFNIYGKYQSENFLIPTILKQLQSGEVIVKDLKPKRDYLYVKDLVILLDMLIEKENISGIFNVGSGYSTSVEMLLDTVKEICKHNLNIISKDIRRENEVLDCYADIHKIQKEISWSPKYSLKAGLTDYFKEVKIV